MEKYLKNLQQNYSNKVYNVGINDMPVKWRSENAMNKRIYSLWHNMIARCYSNYDRYSSYKGCTVDERWWYLSNFVEDLPKIKGYDLWLNDTNYALDKDILDPKAKIYSLQTTQFVTINANLTARTKERLAKRQRSISLYERQEEVIEKLQEQQPKIFQALVRRGVDLALEELTKE